MLHVSIILPRDSAQGSRLCSRFALRRGMHACLMLSCGGCLNRHADGTQPGRGGRDDGAGRDGDDALQRIGPGRRGLPAAQRAAARQERLFGAAMLPMRIVLHCHALCSSCACSHSCRLRGSNNVPGVQSCHAVVLPRSSWYILSKAVQQVPTSWELLTLQRYAVRCCTRRCAMACNDSKGTTACAC